MIFVHCYSNILYSVNSVSHWWATVVIGVLLPFCGDVISKLCTSQYLKLILCETIHLTHSERLAKCYYDNRILNQLLKQETWVSINLRHSNSTVIRGLHCKPPNFVFRSESCLFLLDVSLGSHHSPICPWCDCHRSLNKLLNNSL